MRKLKLFAALFLVILISGVNNEVIKQKAFAEKKSIDIWDLYPVEVGKSWKYLFDTGSLKMNMIITIEQESNNGNNKLFEGTKNVESNGNIISNGSIKIYEENDILWKEEGMVSEALLKRPIKKGTKWTYQNKDGDTVKCEIIDTSYTLNIKGKVYKNCVVTSDVVTMDLSQYGYGKINKVTINYFCPGVGLVYSKSAAPKDLSTIKDHKKLKATAAEMILIE